LREKHISDNRTSHKTKYPQGLYSKFKDRPPADTIKCIEHILAEIGIQTDTRWYNNLGCFYSCRVTISGTDVGTNGKGISRDLALASALAEFMERLQNQILLRADLVESRIFEHGGFRNDVCEVLFAPDSLPSMPQEFKRLPLPGSQLNLYDLWEREKPALAGRPGRITYLPFYNVRDEKVEYLPRFFVNVIYGSSGMCAGNSPREAIVQGLCEIMERYAAGQLYFRHLTPPTIPREYIEEQAPEQYRLIRAMEESGDFIVTVKDCSLGDGLPVAGAIVVHKPANKYSFKIGADPSFAIALERCLTEFYQGVDFTGGIHYLNPINLQPDLKDIGMYQNFNRYIGNGMGVFPGSLFDDRPSYEFQPYADGNLASQGQRLKFLLDWIEQRQYTIFARDVSALGFNSYQLVVPGLSELFYQEKVLDFNRYAINRMEYLGALPRANEGALRELLKDMEIFIAEQKQRLPLLREYAGGKVLAPRVWNNPLHSVLSLLCFTLGEYDKSFRYYSDYVDLMESRFSAQDLAAQDLLPFIYATREFLRLWALYPGQTEKIRKILRTVYDESATGQVMDFFALAESDFAALWEYVMGNEKPACWDCASCGLSSDCRCPRIADIIPALKEKIRRNPIDQMGLRPVFALE
jgi:ribosomal protein S12 methylthiotransferase accessory factor